LIALSNEQVTRLTDEGFCTVAIDNYTHRYGSAALRPTRTTQYQMPTFTVGAVVKWPGSIRIDINFVASDQPSIYLGSIPSKVADLKLFELQVCLQFL
jgi:hypothetical protein